MVPSNSNPASDPIFNPTLTSYPPKPQTKPQMEQYEFHLRLATIDDIPALNAMISLSVRTLHARFYSPAIIDSSMKYVYGVDSALIKDGTYFLIEGIRNEDDVGSKPPQPEIDCQARRGKLEGEGTEAESEGRIIVAAGGWSFRSTLYGGDQFSLRDSTILSPVPTPTNPLVNAAKLRAMFVHPSFTRLGLGKRLLKRCENEARERGFKKMEFGATLAGRGFYESEGYVVLGETEGRGGAGRCDWVLEDGGVLELLLMGKELS